MGQNTLIGATKDVGCQILSYKIRDLGWKHIKEGHFGHFHDMYIKYTSLKCIAFNFGFHF